VRNAQFEEMSVEKMSFRAGSFDGVVAASSIEQSPNPTAALSEIYRVLKVGGIFRMTYEVLEEMAEPVREAVMVKKDGENLYLVDYVVCRSANAEERAFLLDISPGADATRRRLDLWAQRCQDDSFPHRDPRLERGLAQTIRSLRKPEIQRAQSFRLRHFKAQTLTRTLQRVGFADIRHIPGGGWPAQQCAQEMIQARRIETAAPLMEEICRAGARIGIGLSTTRAGQVIACKPRGGRKGRPVKPKASRRARKKS
jgi:SAM-dependent methyltransferase